MIKELIEKYPLKADFCREFKVSPQFLTQLENESRPVPPRLALALSKKFGFDAKVLRPDIFGEPENPL
jgi:hypothetical protein